MKISDIILIVILIVGSFVPLIFLTSFHENKAKKAIVYIDNEIYKTVDLTVDYTFTVKTKYGENTVEVKNNAISVTKADCGDKICVKSSDIKLKGEVIACIPHKLLIEISEEDD